MTHSLSISQLTQLPSTVSFLVLHIELDVSCELSSLWTLTYL